MDHVHDMGGRTDFGPISVEPDEPLFHAEWERRVMGLVRQTVDKHYNWDEFRFAIERLDPPVYFGSSYYERWLSALERFLIEKGVVGENELRELTAGAAPRPGLPNPGRAALWDAEIAMPERFEPGDAVVARDVDPVGHTRLPGYVRGKRGTIERYLGDFVFPDHNALGAGEELQPVYVVRFAASDLWGDARPGDSVCVDLWHSYLEAVKGGTVG